MRQTLQKSQDGIEEEEISFLLSLNEWGKKLCICIELFAKLEKSKIVLSLPSSTTIYT